MPAGDINTMRTRDWGEAASAVSGAYFPHELRALSGTSGLDLAMCTADLGPVTVGRIGWGTTVAIECDYPDAYEVNMPLAGYLECRHGTEVIVSGVGEGTVFPPDTATPITRWAAGCTVVGVKFDRTSLERELDRMLGTPLRGKALLPAQINTSTAAARSWMHFVRTLSADLAHMTGMLGNDLVRAQVAGAITAGFLLAVGPEEPKASAVRPRIVKRVLDRLHDDPAWAWTVTEMAEVAGVSVRRLQEGFREYVGMTPMACLRDIRLARTHEELTSSDRSGTVAEVAARWGFGHTGRFAAAYRRRYGMAPSESRCP